MSDFFPGEGWWMASDGKWYAPQLHHDPAYRARYVGSEPDDAAPEGAEVTTQVLDDSEPPASSEPSEDAQGPEVVDEVFELEPTEQTEPDDGSVEVLPESVETPAADAGNRSEVESVSGSMPPPTVTPIENVEEVPTAAEIRWPDLPPAGSAPTPEVTDQDSWVTHGPAESGHEAESGPEPDTHPVSVGRPRFELPEERPSFEGTRPASVADGYEDHHTRAELEVGRDTSRDSLLGSRVASGVVSVEARRRPPTITAAPSGDLSEIRIYREPADLIDRGIAVALFLSGLLMIVGTFLTWVSEEGGDVSGWERGDGVATVLAGLLGAAAAGPIFVGFRNIVPKTVAIVCGLVGSVVVGLVGLDVLSDTGSAGTELGMGFWITLLASVAMVVAGVAERTSIN